MTIDSFEADLICGRCNQPVNGYAYSSRQGTTVFYCRPLSERDPDCFSLSARAGFPELPPKEPVVRPLADGGIFSPSPYQIAYLQEQARAAFQRIGINKPGSGAAPSAF
jgi:hypothetical protein